MPWFTASAKLSWNMQFVKETFEYSRLIRFVPAVFLMKRESRNREEVPSLFWAKSTDESSA